jgi:hypothetical protein
MLTNIVQKVVSGRKLLLHVYMMKSPHCKHQTFSAFFFVHNSFSPIAIGDFIIQLGKTNREQAASIRIDDLNTNKQTNKYMQ